MARRYLILVLLSVCAACGDGAPHAPVAAHSLPVSAYERHTEVCTEGRRVLCGVTLTYMACDDALALVWVEDGPPNTYQGTAPQRAAIALLQREMQARSVAPACQAMPYLAMRYQALAQALLLMQGQAFAATGD